VNPAALARLRTEAGHALLEALTPYDASSALAQAERLRREADAELVTLALTQARLRTKASERFGADGLRLWWSQETLEQATRPLVSQRRAERLVAAGATRVADLGCGAGMDALAMARAGLSVLAVDRDATAVELVAANAAELGLSDRVTARQADARSVDPVAEGCDAVFVDPARRTVGSRVLDPEQWSPKLSEAIALARTVPVAVIKVAPGLDRALTPDDAAFEAVSADGDLVEVALWFGRAVGTARRIGVALPSGAWIDDQAPRPPKVPVGRMGSWLCEPDDAVIRSGLVAQLAARIDGRLIDPSIAYVTCDEEPQADPLYARFRVDEVLPFSMKALRAALRVRGVGRVEIKKRGFAMDPDEVRRGLKLDRAARAGRTVLLTRIGDDPIAVIAERP
jgi:SAM-dependent methyltransferase